MKKTTEELMEILKQKKSIHAYFTEESTNWNSRP